MKKLKNEIVRLETEALQKTEELRSTLELNFQMKEETLRKENSENLEQLQSSLDEALSQLNQSKRNHQAELISLENTNLKNISLAQQEQKSLNDRLNQAHEVMESTKQDLDKARREAESKSEKDRLAISELQIEITKLKSLISKKETEFGSDKESLQNR